jgi:WD40 repeat protein
LAVIINSNSVASISKDKVINLHDIKTKRLIGSIKDFKSNLTSIGSCPVGKYLFLTTEDNKLYVYSIKELTMLCEFDIPFHVLQG